MMSYIKNIIPRIKEFSKSLDKAEVFVNKNWVFIDEQDNNHEYLFHRDSRLIMTLNGKVSIGSWELLPHGKLLIDRVADKVLLENMFIDDALMILKKSGSEEDAFVLINQHAIPDLDALKYLETQETRKEIQDAQENNRRKVLRSGLIIGSYIMKGDSVESYDGTIPTGTYRTTDKSHEKYVVVENGIVTSTYFYGRYTIKNQELILKQKGNLEINKGDKIINLSDLKIDFSKKLKLEMESSSSYIVQFNENGICISVRDNEMYKLIVGFLILAMTIFLVIYISLLK